MAHQSLYRTYRPQRFEQVRGQDHISRTLRNAVRDSRVGHAYLFSGPRGTGKTSTARILAKALNCAAPEDGEPCGRCDSCVEIAEGRSLDVVELDAASNRGIDAMRDLVSRVALGTAGRWKVYIIDEVHMLTNEASNTLLKTLEEPPGHVIFVLATTEPHKVLPTIRSRTQHFEFRLVAPTVLAEHLRWVAADAHLEVAPEVIDLVAKRGSGSVRDALSALDQAVAAGGIEHESSVTDDLMEALCDHDAGRALAAVADRIQDGHDPRRLTRELIERLREAFLALMARSLVSLPDEDVERVESQARRLGAAALTRGMEELGQALIDMREAPDPRILLEVALVRLARPELDTSVASLVERIERIEHLLAGRSPAVPAATAATPPPAARPPAAATPPVPANPAAAAASATPPPPGSPPPPSGNARPTIGAIRSRLQSASQGQADPAAPPSAPLPPSAAPPPPAPAPPFSAPAGAPAVTPSPAVATTDPSSPFPTREELTLAWGDSVLASLTSRAKLWFKNGRFAAVDGDFAVFEVQSNMHKQRAEECRLEVEKALSQHFGRRVRVRLDIPEGPAPGSTPLASGPDVQPDEEVDWNELQDAPPQVTSPVEHVIQAFEGAEVVEE